MKKTFLLLGMFALLGAGCAKLAFLPSSTSSQDLFGTSHFGQNATPDVQVTLKGGMVRPFPGPFWWDQIETSSDVFDWSKADAEVQKWNKADQDILAVIWPFAQWDQVRCHGKEATVKHPFTDEQVHLSSFCHVDSYQEFVTKLVERYDGDGTDDMPGLTHPIKHWEVSSEPDVQTDTQHFYQAGPMAYAEALHSTYEFIKQADADARVVTGGQNGNTPSGRDFFQQVLPFNRQQFDIANIHSLSADLGFFAKPYRSFINGLGFEEKPFWITEAVVGSSEVGMSWDEETTARNTFIGYATAFGNGAEKVFALEHSSEKAKQVFERMAETVGFFEKAEMIGSNIVLFTVEGKTIFALWDNASLPGDYTNQKVNVIRYDGTKSKQDASSLKADVPMFVIVE